MFASVQDNIDEATREELVSAFVFLDEELGNGFLKTTGFNHPVVQKISNKADWQIRELIRFVATLKRLKETDSNYSKLIRKLLAFEKSKSEGVPFIEIAENYLMVDFQVRFPDETNTSKSPDIEVIHPKNNDRFFIEVSMVNESDERDFISDNYSFLRNQFRFVPPIYLCTGRQKMKISRDDYAKIQKIISDGKKQVEVTQDLFSYSDEKFEFTLAPSGREEELGKVCEQNGTTRNDISSLPLNFDDTERIISNKLNREIRQIPFDSNGIIYLKVNPLFFIIVDCTSLIERLRCYISGYTNILGVVLYSNVIRSQEETFREMGKDVFSRKMFHGVLCRELLFVYNHKCDVKLAEETIQKIYDSFK